MNHSAENWTAKLHRLGRGPGLAPVAGVLALAVWTLASWALAAPLPSSPTASPEPSSPDTLALAALDSALADTIAADSALADTAAVTLGTAAAPLDTVDVDALLRSGKGLILAFEDTLPFDAGVMDTIYATAPRLRLEEVIRRIGERMRVERLALREHSYTALTTVEAVDDEALGRRGKWESYESVSRVRLAPDGTYQQAQVWQRERKWKGQELLKEKIDEDVDTRWGTIGAEVVGAVPFSLESGSQFSYEILDRKLTGLNVIYEIRYEPRSRFKALPSGRVWVDLTDWTIRRLEGRLTETVPLPMFIKAIPVFRVRRELKGETWVVADVYAEVDLRDVPLLGLPDRIRVYQRNTKHVIDGVDYPDEPEPAAASEAGPAAAPAPVDTLTSPAGGSEAP